MKIQKSIGAPDRSTSPIQPAVAGANTRIPGWLFALLLLSAVVAVSPARAQQVVTYPAPAFNGPVPVLPTQFNETVSSCTGTTTMSESTSEFWDLPLAVQANVTGDFVAVTLSPPPNIYTLSNGVSEGQGYSLTAGPMTGAAGNGTLTQGQTYMLAVSGAILNETFVDSQTFEGSTPGILTQQTRVRTLTSTYNIITGVQVLTWNQEVYQTVSIIPPFAGCGSVSTVSEIGTATYNFFGTPPSQYGLGPTGTSTNPQAPGGEPISTGNGNYYYLHTDLSVSDHIAALPLAFQRSYNSLDSSSGPLGNSWTHNFNVTIVPTFNLGSTAVTVKWGDGHIEMFTSNGISNTYISAPGVTSTLTSNPTTGGYTLTRKDGVQYIFSLYLRLSSIQDTNGRTITAGRDANNNLISLTSGQQTLFLTYDANNRLSSVSDLSGRTVSYAYDTNSNLISETDPAGNVTHYAYDTNNRLTSITLPNSSVLLKNTYDSSGRVISQTNADGFTTTLSYGTSALGQTTITDPLGNNTVHTYDSSLRVTSITDVLAHSTNFTYDGNNNVVSRTDANGHTSNFTYDPFGNLLSYADPLGNTAVFTYNSFSEPLTITTPRGNTTNLTYDANGNLISVLDPQSNKTVLTYDGTGDLLSMTDSRGNATSISYSSCTFCITAVTDPIGNKTSFAYDSIGRPISLTDANNQTSAITYDALSRVTSVTDPLGNQTLSTYDSVGHLTSVTDANKHAASYAYDPVGNLTAVTNALGHNTKYAYDKNSNRTNFTNANGATTTYVYDAVNRLLQVTTPLTETTSYAYDASGNVVSLTDANGKTNTFAYDSDNRLTGINYSDGSTVAYAFDIDGDRVSMADAHGATSYAYDALNRVLSTAFPGGKALQYGYDAAGNRTSLQYPDGKVIAYAFDQDNRLSQVTDWLLRNSTYAYDAAGNVTKMTYPNSVVEQFAYDAANRLSQIVDQNGAGTLRTLAYAMDAVGNRTSMTANGSVTNYTYDGVNELTSSTSAGATTSWQYDAVGNRMKQVDPSGTTLYTYDAADQMLTAGAATFTYDKNGNRATRVGSSAPTTYSYDPANRLVSVVSASRKSSFTYDGDGNRVTQSISAGTYNYVDDTSVALPVVLNENGPDGAIDYSYGLGLMESSSSAFNYFYNFDGLGSVSDLTDKNGKVDERYLFDAWGNALTGKGRVGTENKFQFTGQALDPATGLYFLRARYYDPTSGTFLTRDPFPGFAGLPITFHHYIYAGNNPARFVDPSGNFLIGGLVGFAVGSYHTGSFIGGVNGAIAGEFTLDCAEGTGFLGAAGCAAAGSFINDVLNNTFGVTNDSACTVATNALVSGALGGALKLAPGIPGAQPSTLGGSLTGANGRAQWLTGIGNQAVSDFVGGCNNNNQPTPEGAPPKK